MKKWSYFLAVALLAWSVLLTPATGQAGKISIVNNCADYYYTFKVNVHYIFWYDWGQKTYKIQVKPNGSNWMDDAFGAIFSIYVTRTPKKDGTAGSQKDQWLKLWTYVNTCGANAARIFKVNIDKNGFVELIVVKEGC
jgi:hypothetical protein